MSSATKNIIQRQWHIINFLLLDNGYVSTNDIKEYLDQQGIHAEIRTIQRDLRLLEDIIPLECRDDDKPYSWRWQRLPNTKKHQLTLSQALAFRLIETELKEHIPSELMTRLQPVLIKSRFTLAMAQSENSHGKAKLSDVQLPPIIPPSKNGKQGNSFHGDINPLTFSAHSIFNSIKHIIDGITSPNATKDTHDKNFDNLGSIDNIDKSTLNDLKDHLEMLQLFELVNEVETFIQDNCKK